ncbi:MAG: hypothetical protein K6F99_01790 [Lachnospiraceae bacterium]|nr:hypothetical protein [Lachnospiraceae bacterium]
MSNLYKGQFVKLDEDGGITINSNKKIAERLESLSRFVGGDAYGSADEFSEGLIATPVEMLVADGAGEGTAEGVDNSNVIKAEESQRADIAAMQEQARAEAQELLDNANAEATRIIEEASAQAESMKAAAVEEGRTQGHNEGYNAGMAEVEDMKNQLNIQASEMQAQYEKMVEDMEPLLVETLTDIFEHVFNVDFSSRKDVIFYLIGEALKSIDTGRNLIIHVSEDDYGFVSMQKKELLEGISNSDTAEIISDATLKANQCYIETDSGIFDCSLETQMEGLKRELRLLSYKGNGGDGNGE